MSKIFDAYDLARHPLALLQFGRLPSSLLTVTSQQHGHCRSQDYLCPHPNSLQQNHNGGDSGISKVVVSALRCHATGWSAQA